MWKVLLNFFFQDEQNSHFVAMKSHQRFLCHVEPSQISASYKSNHFKLQNLINKRTTMSREIRVKNSTWLREYNKFRTNPCLLNVKKDLILICKKKQDRKIERIKENSKKDIFDVSFWMEKKTLLKSHSGEKSFLIFRIFFFSSFITRFRK